MTTGYRKAIALCVTYPSDGKLRLKSVTFITRYHNFHHVIDFLDGEIYENRDEIISTVLLYAKANHFSIPHYSAFGQEMYDIYFLVDDLFKKYSFHRRDNNEQES